VLWLKIGCMGPTCQAGRPCILAGRPSFHLTLPLGIGYLDTAFDGHVDKMVFGAHGRPGKVMWPTSHSLAQLSPCFVPRHFLVSYCP
jgi:hypothetical protein